MHLFCCGDFCKCTFIINRLSGPYHLNGCPLRRINQRYVIATKTKLDIKGVKVPDRVNDEYFKRQKSKKPKHTEGDIFSTEKEVNMGARHVSHDPVLGACTVSFFFFNLRAVAC